MTDELRRLVEGERIVQFLRSLNSGSRSVSCSLQEKPGAHRIDLPWGESIFVVIKGGGEAFRTAVCQALSHLVAYEHEVCDMTRELSSVYEELTLLYRLSEAFSGTLHIEKIQTRAIQEISCTLEVKKVSLLMLNQESDALVVSAGLGIPVDEIGTRRFAQGQGLAWKVMQERRSIIANDLSAFPEYIPGAKKERSLLLVPLNTKRGLVGVLTVSDKEDGSEFSSKDEKLLTTIANQFGAVWENARLYRETHELFLNTVEALSAAIDAKDPYTHGHSERVTLFSMAIAENMGLSAENLEVIRIAALLHDIGKLGVSEAILRKPARLTTDEFGEVKKHPSIGAEIMGRVKTLCRYIPGMVDHHERYDGTGYPLGRRGSEISLAGRIIAVADTLDAMTSDRPYHPDCKGKPDEVALAEIRRCSGTHYDPVVVEAFLKAYQQGKIKTQSSAVQ